MITPAAIGTCCAATLLIDPFGGAEQPIIYGERETPNWGAAASDEHGEAESVRLSEPSLLSMPQLLKNNGLVRPTEAEHKIMRRALLRSATVVSAGKLQK